MNEHLTIEKLGAQGDGVVQTPAGPIYVPFALPGETVTARVEKQRGTLLQVEQPSPLRTEPHCSHFAVCGGCVVQHLAPEAYVDWKREKIARALRSVGLEGEVDAMVSCKPASRRRVTFTARAIEGRILLGFNAGQSHRIIHIAECPVAMPQITAALDDLRVLASLLAPARKPFRLIVTVTTMGLDIAVRDIPVLNESRRRKAVDFMLAKSFARLSVDDDVVVETKKPLTFFGEVPVAVPPGGFLQATAEAEQAMAELITAHLHGARHVADLFAGSGTFALRLARDSHVHAVEADAAALGALNEAAKRAQPLKPVTIEKRDLFQRPLTEKELNRFDGIVFDPPRAGAEAQCRQIARSSVKCLAAVSCNPGTLARDLAILVEGGYRITRIIPIDQFLWSPHVEVVALLERARKRA